MKYALLPFLLLPHFLRGQVIFEDHFEDDRYGWAAYAESHQRAAVAEGLLTLSGKTGYRGAFFTRPASLPEDQDLVFSAALAQKSGPANFGYGLCWSVSENRQSYFAFLISSNGQYTLLRKQEGVFSEIKPWTESQWILGQGKPNTLSVRKQGQVLRFYINDKHVFAYAYERGRGGELGLLLFGSMKVEVDFLSARMLPPEAAPRER
jgi:hypothetical protein